MYGLPDFTTAQGILEFLVGYVIIRGVFVHWLSRNIEKIFTKLFRLSREEIVRYRHYKQQQINKSK